VLGRVGLPPNQTTWHSVPPGRQRRGGIGWNGCGGLCGRHRCAVLPKWLPENGGCCHSAIIPVIWPPVDQQDGLTKLTTWYAAGTGSSLPTSVDWCVCVGSAPSRVLRPFSALVPFLSPSNPGDGALQVSVKPGPDRHYILYCLLSVVCSNAAKSVRVLYVSCKGSLI